MTAADLATARKEAEVWLAEHGGALWCADVEVILRSLLAATQPAPALPEEVREAAERRIRQAEGERIAELQRTVNTICALIADWRDGNAWMGRPRSYVDQRFIDAMFTNGLGAATKPEEP